MRSAFEVLPYLKRSKKQPLAPIMGRITVNGTIAQFCTNVPESKNPVRLWGETDYSGYRTICYGRDFRYDEDPALVRKGFACPYPYDERIYNTFPNGFKTVFAAFAERTETVARFMPGCRFSGFAILQVKFLFVFALNWVGQVVGWLFVLLLGGKIFGQNAELLLKTFGEI